MRKLYLDKKLVWIILLPLFLGGCLLDTTPKKRKALSTDDTGNTVSTSSENSPNFATPFNIFQNGNTSSSSTFTLPINYQSSFFIRGPEVDNYIRKENFSRVQCLIMRYPDSVANKILVLAANPQYFYDFSRNAKEYYYIVSPSDNDFNINFCKKSGILNYIDATYPNELIAYTLDSVCPGCVTTILKSDTTRENKTKLFDTSGAIIKEINLDPLTLNIDYSLIGQVNTAISCTSSEACKAKGLDCCSGGICVNDGEVKNETDITSDEYQQSLLDIALDPLNIRKYPNLYHICATNDLLNPPETSEEEVNENLQALLRFRELEELYSCINPIKGEMSICTVSIDDISESVGPYFTKADDLNFNTIYSGTAAINRHSITEILHGGEVIYNGEGTRVDGVQIGPNFTYEGNDNFSDKTDVTITHTLSPSAIDKGLRIRYKIDGTCESINTSLAQCKKFYVQGQNLGEVDDHFPATNLFSLPFYADIDRTISVSVNGIKKTEGVNWKLTPGTPSKIEFISIDTDQTQTTSTFVFDDEVVEINYFVNTSLFNVLESKTAAFGRVNSLCGCAPDEVECNLKPVYKVEDFNLTPEIIDYTCTYPEPDVPEPPLQQVVLLSSKSVPARYFDVSGTERVNINELTPIQEGTAFKYEDDLNYLKPNNVDKYVGFNEIYGSLSATPGSAKPPLQVNLKAGSTYDIFVDDGTFSTCFNCGTDYHSTILTLFPKNFQFNGGGYLPDRVETHRSESANHRSDDMLFGRACWLPVTMIPWTHSPKSDTQNQRVARLASQHFLFANGYQRDWFGFDYGSVIGSFDGVTWFSVGNQRRIKAKSNKLYLAINAYFGDLTQQSSFRIVVSDASKVPFSGSSVTNDFFSDGAQCREFHVCSNDQDCATQLGWDYKCETITGIKSPWPSFDINGSEVAGASPSQRLFTYFQANTAFNKRCVYRGKGAPCSLNLRYDTDDLDKIYNEAASIGMLACSMNNYCQPFIEGIPVKKFNNKIARWGKSVKNQNASSDVAESDLDIFGLGARTIGRSFKFNGDEQINDQAFPNLTINKVSNICIPGREADPALVGSFDSSNKVKPTSTYTGDKVSNLGHTMTNNGPHQEYLSSCPTLDTDSNYINFKTDYLDRNLSYSFDPKIGLYGVPHSAGAQSVSTNSLSIIETITGRSFLKDFDNSQITSLSFEKNRCLRAPGASCFTNLDCAPNQFIAAQAAGMDPESENDTFLLNQHEIRFWQEELVCGHKEKKDITNEKYKLVNNFCCRETGKDLTIASLEEERKSQFNFDFEFEPDLMPGIDIALNDRKRYSRMTPMYREMRLDRENYILKLLANEPAERNYPPLKYPYNNYCNEFSCMPVDDVKNSWKTLSGVANRTCCSGSWVRKFDSRNGGSNQAWLPSRFQDINKVSFRCLNWDTCTSCGGSGVGFDCSHVDSPDDPNCKARNISAKEANKYFRFLEGLELTGIPQVSIFSELYNPAVDSVNVLCSVDPTIQSSSGENYPIPNTIKNLDNPSDLSKYEFEDNSKEFDGKGYYRFSTLDSENFESNIKTIWARNEFRCCLPSGTTVDDTTQPEECCTGLIANSRCALPDYTNVSLYFNRFISSEAKELSDTEFNPYTGFIKNINVAQQLACSKQVCASGKIANGVALSNLPVHGFPKEQLRLRRFVDGDGPSNAGDGINKLYDAGLRWNNHIYCVPSSLNTSTQTGLTVIDCTAFPSNNQ